MIGANRSRPPSAVDYMREALLMRVAEGKHRACRLAFFVPMPAPLYPGSRVMAVPMRTMHVMYRDMQPVLMQVMLGVV